MTACLTVDDSLCGLPRAAAIVTHKKGVNAFALTPDTENQNC